MTKERGLGVMITATTAVVFGALTVVSGGSALFGGPAAQAAVGDAVPFVLWFNFLAGFAYVAAGLGLFLKQTWGFWLSVVILAATVLVFVAFGVHVFRGGAYEMRTVGAMILRAGVWAAIVVTVARSSFRDDSKTSF